MTTICFTCNSATPSNKHTHTHTYTTTDYLSVLSKASLAGHALTFPVPPILEEENIKVAEHVQPLCTYQLMTNVLALRKIPGGKGQKYTYVHTAYIYTYIHTYIHTSIYTHINK